MINVRSGDVLKDENMFQIGKCILPMNRERIDVRVWPEWVVSASNLKHSCKYEVYKMSDTGRLVQVCFLNLIWPVAATTN